MDFLRHHALVQRRERRWHTSRPCRHSDQQSAVTVLRKQWILHEQIGRPLKFKTKGLDWALSDRDPGRHLGECRKGNRIDWTCTRLVECDSEVSPRR